MRGQRQATLKITPRKETVTFLQEVRWASRAVRTGAENLTHTELRSRAVQPLDSRYTDRDIRPTEYTALREIFAEPNSSGVYVHFNKHESKTNLHKCSGLKYDLHFF